MRADTRIPDGAASELAQGFEELRPSSSNRSEDGSSDVMPPTFTRENTF